MPKIAVSMDDRGILEPSTVANMIDLAPTPRDKAIIALYYIFGVRRCEPLDMVKENIWIEDGWLFLKVKREKVPKHKVLPRIDTLKVSLNTPFLSHLVSYWESLMPNQLLFQYHTNPKTSSLKIYHMIKKTNPNVWIHLFRHTRAERFREAGYSDAELMAWFGWLDSRTPSNYTHPSNKTIEDMGGDIR